MFESCNICLQVQVKVSGFALACGSPGFRLSQGETMVVNMQAEHSK